MPRRSTLHILSCSLVLLLLFATSAAAQPNAVVPPNFADVLVTSVGAPTALAFTPDGRLLIATQPGALRVYRNGTLLPTPALDLGPTICANRERGLLGVVADPDFATNHFIYIYYTFRKFPQATNPCPDSQPANPDNPVNRVSRFVLPSTNVIAPASEVVLVDNIPSPNGNHNAGDLHFGKDGYLYISVGDGGCQLTAPTQCSGQNQNARRLDILSGKILRIRGDGAIPPINPWASANGARRCGDPAGVPAGSGPCAETFAWGLRNPYRLAFDPNASGTRFFINDVGQGVWEEIDDGQPGADYGWNVREGFCAEGSTTDCGAPPAGMTNPIIAYQHGPPDNCTAITGGAFVPRGAWPSAYDGVYLFGDYGCQKIFQFVPGGAGGTITFASGVGELDTMTFGPYGAGQALYYATYSNGQVRRIAYTGTQNRTPTAVLVAQPSAGASPLTVTFDARGSSDPDAGDTLTYLWDFGDQSAPIETTTVTTTHTYISATTATYTATLRVRDNHGAVSAPADVRIDVDNTPPVPEILAPTTDARFHVGQTITLHGRATDAEEGALPDSALTWTVTLHHNTHTHPFLPPTAGNDLTITAPAPEDLDATATSYLEIQLSAADSRGLTGVITQALRPHLVDVTFTSAPAGRALVVNGGPITAPRTLLSWEGYPLAVDAPLQQDAAGEWLRLASWSDGGAATHTITTPAATTVYTATFQTANPLFLPLMRR